MFTNRDSPSHQNTTYANLFFRACLRRIVYAELFAAFTGISVSGTPSMSRLSSENVLANLLAAAAANPVLLGGLHSHNAAPLALSPVHHLLSSLPVSNIPKNRRTYVTE